MKNLEHLCERMEWETLPPNWNTFDLERFSEGKRLWGYQRKALQSALCVLYRYYEEFEDFVPGGDRGADEIRKRKTTAWYEDGLRFSRKERRSLDTSLKRVKYPLLNMLSEFYELDGEDPEIGFREICNRMGFWMATGSGKTIVLVKLMELLHTLMRREEIPEREMLFLTHRDDLLEQFFETVTEFNRAPDSPVHIELHELRDYPEVARDTPGGLLGKDSTLRVFWYRSDNLSDVHKERIVDFHNYDNHGRWYVVLDEAHKGKTEDAKRKHIVNILSRQGFLFNFSATFTDTLDLATTVHNFNLSQFVGEGYGKHVAVLRQELAAFKKRGKGADYSDEEKRKVVLKSMILQSLVAEKVREVRGVSGETGLYHHPMLLTLVNSVNTKDADLKLYFQQILSIGRGDIPEATWIAARDELWEELREQPEFLYEDGRGVEVEKERLMAIGPVQVLRDVYNVESGAGGDVEVMVRPDNHKEIAFKLKTAERPFALIKIGDVMPWLRETLTGFAFIETLERDSFFDALNSPGSPINILMGSRTFYEGWDSNRPNVINFVNIGTGSDARKFILQSVGRGVRVQSWKGERRRLEELHERFVDRELFRGLRTLSELPETLFVMGTNREALDGVLNELRKEKTSETETLRLVLNPLVREHPLYIPVYRRGGKALIEDRAPSKFEIAEDDYRLLDEYADAVVDDRVMLLSHGGRPKNVGYFRDSLEKPETYYARRGGSVYRNLEVMVGRTLNYFGMKADELEGVRSLDPDQDIVHFTRMTVDRRQAAEIQARIDKVLHSQTPEAKNEVQGLYEQVQQGEFDFAEAARVMEDRGLTGRQTYNDEVAIEYLANHFYMPVLMSTRGKRISYLKHIIDVYSEVRFLAMLREYVKRSDCPLKGLDWWMFSKLDPHLDTPYIPYYDALRNQPARFVPDFIFWGQRGDDYTILFVDPKGMENADWMRKVEGFQRLFQPEGEPRGFQVGDTRVKVELRLFTRDRNRAAEGDTNRFWTDSVGELAGLMPVVDEPGTG